MKTKMNLRMLVISGEDKKEKGQAWGWMQKDLKCNVSFLKEKIHWKQILQTVSISEV